MTVKPLPAVLRECVGRVAISGYGEEWDGLGWHRQEKRTMRGIYRGTEIGSTYSPRTEVLWTNYDVGAGRLL